MSNNEYATFNKVTCSVETKKALLVTINGEEHWMPKSQIHEDSEVSGKDDEGKLTVTVWIAEQKRLTVPDSEEDRAEEDEADTGHPGHPSNYGSR